MAKIRVLVVDDAVVIRKLISDALNATTDIEVVGVAANGRIGLQKITQCNPDVITLDIEMPEMDGLQTLKEIRKTNATIPIIMFSSLTERGAESTLDALSFGASDYVTKPANVGKVTVSRETIEQELIAKVRGFGTKNRPVIGGAPRPQQAMTPVSTALSPASAQPLASPRIHVSSATRPVELTVIGVSTGGPNALAEVIPSLPANFSVPIAIVQHMPPLFTKLLADRLNSTSQLRVFEAVEGQPVKAGEIYIAPGGFHLEIVRSGAQLQCHLTEAPQENSCRPAADVLFRSAVAVCGGGVLGVVLTGMGQDGLRGCELIKEAGGQVIAQDEASSVVWGMPGAVVGAALADSIHPLNEISTAMTQHLRRNVFLAQCMQQSR